MTQWKKLLKTLGFSESEATIYLTSLEMGPASVQDIAKRAKVSRVTTYAVIETMAERGLMSSVEKGKKRLYVAESPERLISFVSKRVKEMETTLKEVEGALNELKLIQRGEKPVVKMFEGLEGMNAVYDDILQSKPKAVDEFANMDDFRKLHPREQREGFMKEMERLKPKSRALYITSTPIPNIASLNLEAISIPSSIKFSGGVLVYGDRVTLSSFKGKLISVIIESSEIAQTVRSMFDYIWEIKENTKNGGKK